MLSLDFFASFFYQEKNEEEKLLIRPMENRRLYNCFTQVEGCCLLFFAVYRHNTGCRFCCSIYRCLCSFFCFSDLHSHISCVFFLGNSGYRERYRWFDYRWLRSLFEDLLWLRRRRCL